MICPCVVFLMFDQLTGFIQHSRFWLWGSAFQKATALLLRPTALPFSFAQIERLLIMKLDGHATLIGVATHSTLSNSQNCFSPYVSFLFFSLLFMSCWKVCSNSWIQNLALTTSFCSPLSLKQINLILRFISCPETEVSRRRRRKLCSDPLSEFGKRPR